MQVISLTCPDRITKCGLAMREALQLSDILFLDPPTGAGEEAALPERPLHVRPVRVAAECRHHARRCSCPSCQLQGAD